MEGWGELFIFISMEVGYDCNHFISKVNRRSTIAAMALMANADGEPAN